MSKDRFKNHFNLINYIISLKGWASGLIEVQPLLQNKADIKIKHGLNSMRTQ